MAIELSARQEPPKLGRAASIRAGLAIAVAIGGGGLVFDFVPLLADSLGITTDLGINLVGNLLWLLLAFAGALLFRRRLALAFGKASPAALALGIGGFATALALVALAGHVSMRHRPPFLPLGYGLGTAGLLLGALAEEALFRGFLQPLLRDAWGTTAGVLVAALGFTVVHAIGGWRDVLSLANIALAGIWFGVLAVRGGGFGAPFLAHAGWNWAEALLFGAAPNPGVDPAGSIVDMDLAGPAWLGGSGDGMNSALATTLVLGVLIALALLLPRRVPAR